MYIALFAPSIPYAARKYTKDERYFRESRLMDLYI